MGNKKFGLTTYVIVGISLVALYFVGRTVTPPPLVPPVEVNSAASKAPTAPSPASMKREFEARKAEAQSQMRAQAIKNQVAKTKAGPNSNVKAFNPSHIDTDASYWQDRSVKEGAAGVKEMAAKVEAAKATIPSPEAPQTQKVSPVNPPH